MMPPRHSTVLHYSLLLCIALTWPDGVTSSIFQSVFGLPTECVHHNKIRPCKLSFTCWLQGGKHAQGCGENKWLFSCCVPERESSLAFGATDTSASAPTIVYVTGSSGSGVSTGGPAAAAIAKSVRRPHYGATKEKQLRHALEPHRAKLKGSNKYSSKKNILRRRTDDGGVTQHPVDCGIPKTAENTIQKRIIGGRTAQFAEYPWQAHIRIAEFQCGGVLVSRHFIATAAHCIQQARLKDIIVYLGELDTQNAASFNEPLPAEKHRVLKKLIHPRFQFRVTQPDRYDLALLQLATPAAYKNHIQPICLPTGRVELVGRKGIIAGWGKTQANMGHTGTNILQSAAVPIISTDDCISWHESKQINVELYDEMFCAGHSDGHQDACLGDSGGPLIVTDLRGRFTLVGITSAGFGCGIDHQPGIYHNVQMTTKWIQDVIHKSF